MFLGFGQPPVAEDVDGILDEGRSWVDRLLTAANAAKKEAGLITNDINVLTTQKDNLLAKATEGREVATNFKQMLNPKK